MINKQNHWICNGCRKRQSFGKAHYCTECDYDICEDCIKKTVNTEKNYGHPHRPILYQGLHGWFCDNCGEPGDNYKTRFRCNECDFDLCLNCHYAK